MADKIILNYEQKQAVIHNRGPLLIIAGAGTGKTTVITEHVKHLIQKRKLSPSNIFATTFTEKSATDMLERLDLVMPLGYEEPWLGTFHSLCDRVLRNEALEIGIDPGYKIITPVEQWILIRKHLFDFKLKYYLPLGNPSKFISALIKYFSRLQDEDVDFTEIKKLAQKKNMKAQNTSDKEEAFKINELAEAFNYYQQIKIKESVLDFGDLISQTLKLFRTRKSILRKYQNQFTHILVDEFQDTNYSQYQLIKLLCPQLHKPNLFVVGDDDQSIYKFRGAAVSNILQFKNDYPDAREVVLRHNYRSLKPILISAYSLIQNNNPDRLEKKLNINKKLLSKRKEKKSLTSIIKTSSEMVEVDFVINKILELVAKEKYSYKDFAVLVRANSQLNPFVSGFKRLGVPYQLIGNRGLFDQEEIAELLLFLQVVSNPEDSSSLFHFLHFKEFKLPADLIIYLLNESKMTSMKLWEVLKNQESDVIKQVVSFISDFQKQSLNQSVSKLLYNFIFQTGYVKDLAKNETIENELKIKNINLLFEKIKIYESDNRNSRLPEFIETVNLWQEAGDNPAQAVIEDIDTISLLTIHSAKGLEFPVVFVPSMIAGRFPVIFRRDAIEFPDELIKETLPEGNENIQEERRLLYVAMTRAEDHLFLSYANDYGGVRVRKPSGFLKETKLKEEVMGVSSSGQLSLKNPNPSPTIRYLNKKGKLEIKYLSYSQVDTFIACPLKYKYRYLLKVPAEPHHALSFGNTMHTTLHEFHRFEQQGMIPTKSKLLKIYEKNFIDFGYESERHKQERFKAGKLALTNYHKQFKKIFGKPEMLETRFRLNISGIPFLGKIDRIDKTAEGYEIIDYKTGEAKDQASVDKDRQLTIYSLAAKEVYGMVIEKMSLYFIEDNLKISTSRDHRDIIKEKENLKKMTEKIRSSDFPPKSGFPFPCRFCEYNRICPFAAKA